MLNIARLPSNDRRDLFRAAAQKMRVNAAIVEKDFWVCWTLDYLFHESPWQDKLAFYTHGEILCNQLSPFGVSTSF